MDKTTAAGTTAGQEAEQAREEMAPEFRAAPLEDWGPEEPKAPEASDTEATALDEFHGQGGSYVVDSATGKRKLVARTGWKANETEVTEDGSV